MKRWTLALLVPALWGAGPQPLLVGVVHDQYGQPIAGARVRAGAQQTATDAAGTFAMPSGSRQQTLVITCSYCASLSEPVRAGEPVIAIVRRYERISQDALTDRDLQAIPYSDAASAVSLTPYAVLNDSASPVPGARVSMYGASTAWGGVPIDNGIPDYDVAASVPTFQFFPTFSPQQLDVRGPDQAFRYGDNAGSGSFFIGTHAQPGVTSDAAIGGQQAALLAQSAANFAAAFAIASSPTDSRNRVDATWTLPAGDDAIQATVVHAFANEAPSAGRSLDSAFDAVKLAYRHAGAGTIQAAAILDQGGYNGGLYPGTGVDAGWSDFAADAGIQTPGTLHAFADVSLRSSTGFYDESDLASNIAGTIAQDRIDAGAQTSGSNYSASAGVGAYTIAYAGGTGSSQPYDARIVLPSLSFAYAPSAQWSASLTSGAWFRLPSLLETYGLAPAQSELPIERSASTIAQIDYGDLRRVRIELVGVDGGARASGATLGWEIAPDISLRAWTLAFDNPLEGSSGTVNSVWTTYENPGGLRLDLVERRDLLDGAENQHLDASVSAPLSSHIRWFAATERPTLARFYEIGIQTAP